MGPWGFVGAAYGIVWCAILLYWWFLKRRYRQAEAELERLKAAEARVNDGEK